jgi:Family of unknown function (DUF6758)
VALAASCPRCTTPLEGDGAEFTCARHGSVVPLWRSATSDYTTFAEVVRRAAELPTYLPWPMSPGWSIADFGCVAADQGPALATVTTTTGASALDGEVEVTVVTEEPGVGLGSRVAGAATADPGVAVGQGAASIRVRVDARPVPMWVLPSSDDDDLLALAAFVGEAGGRWLWLVMRPASAALLLRDDWLLADASGFGPEAIEMPFGGPPPAW